jgi:hypothetical protein
MMIEDVGLCKCRSGRDNELSRDKNISKKSGYIFRSCARAIYLSVSEAEECREMELGARKLI